MKATTIIGIAGGSGSGKTTVTNGIMKDLEGCSVTLLTQDYYYKDQKRLTSDERPEAGYDHPFAFDNDLLIESLKDLKSGKTVEIPAYDYASYTGSDITIDSKPKDVITVEGIFALENKVLRNMMDVKTYVGTDADLRVLHRLTRDIKERGRSTDSVINQYSSVVRPMYDQFTEPTKKYTDIIIPEGGSNKAAIGIMTTKAQSLVSKQQYNSVKEDDNMENQKQYPVTQEGFERLECRLKELKTVKRSKVVEEIKAARSFGDLLGSSGYDAAGDEQGFIKQDTQRTEHMLRNTLVIEDTRNNNVVEIGKTVTFVELPDDEEESYQIIGSVKLNAFSGKISDESPMAGVLIGRGLDGEVRVPLPNGDEMNIKIVNIQ